MVRVREIEPRRWTDQNKQSFWRVRYRDLNGKQHDRRFKKKEDADDLCKQVKAARKRLGKAAAASTDEVGALALWRKYVEDEHTAGRDPGSLRDVLKDVLVRLRAGVDTPSLNVLIKLFLKAQKQAGVSKRHYVSLGQRLGRIKGYLDAETPIGEFTIADIEKALNELALTLSAQTVKGIRSSIHAAFQWAEDRDMVPRNPVKKAKSPKVHRSEIGVLTPGQFKSLLQTALRTQPSAVVPFAIWGFCGVRRAELCRLTWDDVDLTRKEVRIPAAKAKTRIMRFIPFPMTCLAWINAAIQAGVLPRGRLLAGKDEDHSEYTLRRWLKEIRKEAAITEWPNNALRHSFASYACAATEDYSKVATWLGHHRDSSLLVQRYRHAVTKEKGLEWFDVGPERDSRPAKFQRRRSNRAS